jgi:peptide methionine sulfoxide reductase msrA/msrB
MSTKIIVSSLVSIGVVAAFAFLYPKTETVPPAPTPEKVDALSENIKTALLANGCFWCVESDLEKLRGVINVVSGYAGGETENPTYANYAAAGHREVVEVTYDASVVSFANLVEHIVKHGDPTDARGSFYDRGEEYAPAVYVETDVERETALEVFRRIDALGVLAAPVAIAVLPRVPFWPAEEYHQNYARENSLKYSYYRKGSGRDAFIQKYWGERAGEFSVSSGL